jgi:hypothetical protein
MDIADLGVGGIAPALDEVRMTHGRGAGGEPVLDPRIGWSQGVAGISALLFRYVRIQETGADAPRQQLPDNSRIGR